MTDNELKLLADHMGHSLQIHTDVYRLQSSLLEKAKVAKLLIAVENGSSELWKNRSMQSIDSTGKIYSTGKYLILFVIFI